MSNLAADKVLRVNCPGWGVSSTLPLGEAKPLAMYDVIVINPTSIIHLFEPKSDAAKQIEKALADGTSTLKMDSDSTLESISAELELREHELRQFLSKGGLLIYFLAPAFTVSGASMSMDNYLWLYEAMPDKLDGKNRTVKESKAKELSPSPRGNAHPFSAYLQQLGLEAIAGIKKDDLTEGYKSLADGAGHVVAATKSTGPKRGQVVFLPAPYDIRYDDVLKDCIMKWNELHTGPDADKPEPDFDESAPAAKSEKSEKSEKSGKSEKDDQDVEGRALLDDLFNADEEPKKSAAPAYEAAAASSGGSDFDSLDALFAPSSKSDGKSEDSKKSSGSDADKLFDDAPAPAEKKKSTLDWPELEDDVPPFAKEREEEKKREKAKEEEKAREAEKAKEEKARDEEKAKEEERAKEKEKEEKAREEEREREREKEKARDEEREKEREKERAEKEKEEAKEREREKAREEERELEREKAEREREREKEKAREEEREREREREREAERDRERERMREEERKAERDREEKEADKQREQDKAREKAREMQKELERLRDEEQDRQRRRDEERERSNGADSNYPEAKDLMSRMEQEISSPGVPDWCQKVSFSELKQLHTELNDLQEQVRKARQKINDVEDRIRNLGELKDALLSLSGVRLTQACCKVFEALGWSVKVSETSAGEVWLSDGDKTQAIVRIVYAAEQPNRSELAELAESVITYWGKYDVEPKGILVASTFAEKAPKERNDEDFPGSMGEFAKRKNLCLFTCMQLLTIYRDVAIKGADVRKIRENLLTTSGILPGFKLDTVEAKEKDKEEATA